MNSLIKINFTNFRNIFFNKTNFTKYSKFKLRKINKNTFFFFSLYSYKLAI